MAEIELIRATAEQEPILARLLELYAHDFSEFHDLELGPDGKFGYRDLPLYWVEPGRHPFLIRVDSRWAGLVLVKGSPEILGVDAEWDMAEFFVVRGHRRRGVGLAMAEEVWRRFPGRWGVRVMESNRSALDFWERAVAAFAGENASSERFEADGQYWRRFTFESGHGA